MEITAKTAFEAWKKALSFVLKNGKEFNDEGRVCKEVLNLSICILDPTKGTREPIEELRKFKKWVYPPIEEIKEIALEKKSNPAYTYSYGPRIFNFQEKIDQINNYVIPLLKNNPYSRRGVVSFWDPTSDSITYKKDVPSLLSIDFLIRDGKLNTTYYIRSNDLFFGFPANVYQLFIIQEYVANQLDIPIGSLTIFSASAHIFDDQFENIQDIIKLD